MAMGKQRCGMNLIYELMPLVIFIGLVAIYVLTVKQR